MRRAGRAGVAVGALLLLGLAADAGAAPRAAARPEDLADFDARTEYAFFTEDARALERLLSGAQDYAASAVPRERYQYAHAAFRALQLASLKHLANDAQRDARACLAALDSSADLESRDVEDLALEAACAGYVALQGGLKGLAAGHRAEARLEAARTLAPGNPRVLLTAGLARWFRAGAGTEDRAAARAAFEAAAHAFDTVTLAAPGDPSWGAAEAWLFAGHADEEAGDLIGARSAYERALLIAPEFAAARRGLARLAARR